MREEEHGQHYEGRQPPEFSVVFKGPTMEPMADVAPEGDVTFVLVNESGTPHDFALVHRDRRPRQEQRHPLEHGEAGVVGCLNRIAPGGAQSATYHLDRGRYVLITNTPGDHLGTRLFDLTVQPIEG